MAWYIGRNRKKDCYPYWKQHLSLGSNTACHPRDKMGHSWRFKACWYQGEFFHWLPQGLAKAFVELPYECCVKCFFFIGLLVCRSNVHRTLENIFTARPLFEPMGSLAHYGPLFLTETLNYPIKMLSFLLVCYPECCHKHRFLPFRRGNFWWPNELVVPHRLR